MLNRILVYLLKFLRNCWTFVRGQVSISYCFQSKQSPIQVNARAQCFSRYRKPDWIRAAVLMLHHQQPGCGYKTIAQIFNLQQAGKTNNFGQPITV